MRGRRTDPTAKATKLAAYASALGSANNAVTFMVWEMCWASTRALLAASTFATSSNDPMSITVETTTPTIESIMATIGIHAARRHPAVPRRRATQRPHAKSPSATRRCETAAAATTATTPLSVPPALMRGCYAIVAVLVKRVPEAPPASRSLEEVCRRRETLGTVVIADLTIPNRGA